MMNPTINNSTLNTNDGAGSHPAPPSVQAQDAPVSSTSVSEFSDGTGVVVGGSQQSPELDYITQGDESLAAYFSRPALVYTAAWSSSAFSAVQFDPWTLFMSNSYVKKKYDNYAMFRATLHLRATFNGTPLQAGALQMSYAPGPCNSSGNSYVCVPTGWSVYRGSQLRNVEIYGSGSTSGEIVAPFFFRKPFAGLTGDDLDIPLLGRVRVQQLVPLTSSANAVVVPGTVQIYAWLTDVQLRVATWKNAMHRSPIPKAELRGDFNISRPATVVARAATMLSGLPFIGPYATVASTVASGIASVASVFGFARPLDVRDKSVMIPRYMGGMALTEGLDAPEKLSTDPKQGVAIGSAWMGLPAEPDPMSIASIASREMLFSIDAASWTTSVAVGTTLASFPVYPHAFNKMISTGVYEISPISYAAAPFANWTGSVTIRVKAIAGGMSRGRLLIWHYPHNDAAYATATYDQIINTCQCCVLDLESSTDVEFTVRPSMTKPWMAMNLANLTAVDVLTGEPVGNGRVVVTVINALSAPLASSVGLLYYARGGPDFQVANPKLSYIQNWGWRNAMDRGAVDSSVPTEGPGGTANPNASCDLTARSMREAPVEPYFGERIESFRSLAKRFTFKRTYTPKSSGAAPANTVAASLLMDCDFYGTPNYGLTFANLAPWTWLEYAATPFLAIKGGVRLRAVVSGLPGGTAVGGARIGWIRAPTGGSGLYSGRVAWIDSTNLPLWATFSSGAPGMWVTSGDGMSYTPLERQPVAEVELPYYSSDLFTYLGSSVGTYKHPECARLWAVVGWAAGATVPMVFFETFQAAADDFSAMEWCGMGQVTVDTAYPSMGAPLTYI